MELRKILQLWHTGFMVSPTFRRINFWQVLRLVRAFDNGTTCTNLYRSGGKSK